MYSLFSDWLLCSHEFLPKFALEASEVAFRANEYSAPFVDGRVRAQYKSAFTVEQVCCNEIKA